MDNHTFANIRKFAKSTRSNVVHALKRDPAPTVLTTDNIEKATILGKYYEGVHQQNTQLGDTFAQRQ